MSYGILYNVFTCWVVTIMGLMAAREMLNMPSRELAWRALGWFWVFASSLWLLAGLRLLAYFFGMPELDRKLFYLDEVFVGLHMIAAVVFLAERIWRRRPVTNLFFAFAVLMVFVFLGFLIAFGIESTIPTPWASEHKLHRAVFLSFLPLYSCCLLLLVYATINDVVGRIRHGAWRDGRMALATASLAMYAVAGVFDVRGIFAEWHLLLVRVVYLVTALTAFWVARGGSPRISVIRSKEES